AVDHLGQVHDHRRALPEVLPDGPRLVVGPGVQRSDARKVSGTGLVERYGTPLDGRRGVMVAFAVRGLIGSGKLAAGFVLATAALPGVGFLVVELVLVVVAVLVVAVVLHKAEVDRHLAHRAGHTPLRVLWPRL